MVYVEAVAESHDTPNERFDALSNKIKHNHPQVNIEQVRKAFEYAHQAHQGQVRVSGEPYVFHVISVAEILLSLNLDTDSLMAALLHDVVEDTEITLVQLEQNFGSEVTDLVDSVTKMKAFSHLKSETNDAGLKAENLRKLLLAMAEDVRVVMIKLADRLHNMRTLYHLPLEKQKIIAHETSEIYAPLANRLGIWQIKWELEDLAFRYLDPSNYQKVAQHLSERKVDRDHYIKDVVDIIHDGLAKNNIKAEVTGRSKHIYSIWKKMQRKNLGFAQLYDIRAVRIHVEKLNDCYHALGIIHALWPYIHQEFDDYIATPKENNYQSIHTAVLAPQGKTLEVQIRTFDMHNHAEYGVAAHWRYKEGGKQSGHYEQKIAWLRQLLEWKEKDAGDFIDRFKSEVFQDRVYVMTPEGEIIDMPQGATPLDFAFYVHTEVGACCRGATVNGKMVALTYELKSGEQVHILTDKKGSPSRDWLNPQLGYLKTSRARAKVKYWFKQQNYDHNLIAGRDILEKEFHRLAIQNISYEKLSHTFHFNKIEQLFASIGRGDITTGQIANALHQLDGDAVEVKKNKAQLTPQNNLKPIKSHKKSGDVTVDGVDNVLTQIAHCCQPVPGDSIVGFITKHRGITIHRSDCANIQTQLEEKSKRLIEVTWNNEIIQYYAVIIEVIAIDKQGLLHDISTILQTLDINVLSLNTVINPSDYSTRMRLTLEISGVAQLSSALNSIVQLSNVIEAYRIND